MRLNRKIALTLALPMVAAAAVLALLLSVQVLSRFESLEHAELEQNHERLLQAIDADFEALERVARDWGLYDETYYFIAGENPEFVEANFTAPTLDNLQLNGIVLFDLAGQTRTEFGYTAGDEALQPLDPELIQRIAGAIATTDRQAEHRHGILEHAGRVLLLAISAIQDSEGSAASNGTLVMFRYLDQGTVDALAERIRLRLRFQPLTGPGSESLPADAIAGLRGSALWSRIDDQQQVSSFSYLNDLADQPAMLMQVSMPRDIYREGQATVRQLLGFTLGTLLAFVVGTFLAIRQVALRRLGAMRKRLRAIGSDEQTDERLVVQGDDEISEVASSINGMLDRLRAAFEQRQHAAERQRELNALLVRIATDQSLAEGDADALFSVLGGSLAAATAPDRWSLWLSDQPKGAPVCLRASGVEGAPGFDAQGLQALLRARPSGSGEPVSIEFAADRRHHGLAVPFSIEGRDGALCVESFDPQAFRASDEVAFLLAAAQLIERSLGTHFARLREQALRDRAERDALTGLANRAMFEHALRRELEQLDLIGAPVGVLFIDLDRFKPINDSYGHAVGDWLLVQVAERLRERVRAHDLIARLGGDEFTVILRALKSPEDARRVADKILEALARPFEHSIGRLQIGCSIGIAVAPLHADTYEELVEAADLAMYRAKQGGRNHYVMCESAVGG